MPKARSGAASYGDDTPFDQLPTLLLERLASALSRHGELLYQRLFGLHLSECRVLAVVLAGEPISLRVACEKLEIDKSHVSRMVTKLVGAGLLLRRPDAADQRSFYLILTPEGRRLAVCIRAAAAERNREWMKGLEEGAPARLFLEVVAQQTAQAKMMLSREVKSAGRSVPASARESPEEGTRAGPAPLLVDRPQLEEMRQILDRLLNQ